MRVTDNEVILDGAAERPQGADRAHELALDTPGVVHVRDRIITRRGRRYRQGGFGYQETRRWSS